jgi:hypothetical protein
MPQKKKAPPGGQNPRTTQEVRSQRHRRYSAARVSEASAAIVKRHRDFGLDVKPYTLGIFDVFPGGGRDQAPLVCGVVRGDGHEYRRLAFLLGENDVGFAQRDGADPLAIVTWATWVALLGRRR